jgi:hypothetical protein
MKTLIALLTLLISFSSLAQTLVTIKPNDSKLASMSFEMPNKKKAIKRLKKLVRKSQWLKGAYQESDVDTIFSRESTRSVATGNTVESTDIDGETISVPEYISEEYLEHFKPSNFSIITEDVSAERAAEEKEEKDSKKEVKRLKARINDLEIEADHKKLLKKIVKKCLGE